jgi:UDP-glucuronate 4-epimerase
MPSDHQGTTLVTGAAGFIGFHLSQALLDRDTPVIGVDNLNAYYDVRLKRARLNQLEARKGFTFYQDDVENLPGLEKVFRDHTIRRICHLAAQAGVRYSLENPFSYQKSNLEGFLNLLEMARHGGVDNFVFASSSSVYGANTKFPFSVDDRVDKPVSLYGATKRANELMAYSYHHLFHIPLTGLRFFTVYGPWGRPDMALFLFTDAILNDRPIDVYNHGRMRRDFTYIDDIIRGTMAALDKPSPFEIFNLGNSDPVELLDFIAAIEEGLGKEAKKNMMPIQPGDVPATAADIEKSRRLLGFDPKTPIKEGINKFLAWYRDYYNV